MKWYQPIECDNTVQKPLLCDYSNFEDYGFDEEQFKSGNKVTGWSSKIFMKANQKKYDGYPDNVLQNAFMIPVYSKNLMDKLVNADIMVIQYLPIKALDFK